MSNIFGKALRAIRLKKDLSISTVSVRSGLPYIHILQIEQGKKIHITTSTIDRLALGLSIPISKLVRLYGKSLKNAEENQAKGLDLNRALKNGTPLNWQGIQLDDNDRRHLQLWFENRFED